jgi:hypothetical protein
MTATIEQPVTVVRDMRSAVNEPAAQPLVALADESALMLVITRAAQDPKLDLDRVQRLFEMHAQLQAKRAEQQFIDAMARFKQDAPRIFKDKAVDFTSSKGRTYYRHASLGNVVKAGIEGLAKVGISHRWDLEQLQGGRIRVTCVLTHTGGHSTKTVLEGSPDDSGNKNSIQMVSSTISYLERYTFLAATGLATEDQDDDGRGAGKQKPTVSAEQIADLEALITEVGANREAFLKLCKVESLSDILAVNYTGAVRRLEDRRKNQK